MQYNTIEYNTVQYNTTSMADLAVGYCRYVGPCPRVYGDEYHPVVGARHGLVAPYLAAAQRLYVAAVRLVDGEPGGADRTPVAAHLAHRTVQLGGAGGGGRAVLGEGTGFIISLSLIHI